MVNSILPVALAAMVAGPGGPGKDKVSPGAAGDLQVETPAVAEAQIDVNARLDDAAWQDAALLHSFTQYDPVEGVSASQTTEVLVLVDADAIYFGVRAFDDNPDGIRATLAERDEFDRSDDYIRFILDTFDDQRRAYVFSVNPLGVQHDGVWNEGGGGRMGGFRDPIDDNPDFLWESSGQLVDSGYVLEVRIPFKSLRFPEADEQSWGLQIIRNIQRNGFKESWAPITSNTANKLTQAGKLTGLRNIDAGLFMEINPVLTGKRLGAYDDDLDSFVREDPDGDFGLNLTYGLTSNLTLDATYNPDFSQVEADAGQIAVNERFALFFPEKRPFFLEGTEIFSLPKNLVYTRSIVNPIAGAKVTGKVGGWNLGYIGAVDESLSGDADNTVANLMRLRKDLGASSTLGLVLTDRTRSGSEYNRLAGADARLVFAQRYTVTLLGAASRTANGPEVDPANGLLWSARVERASRGLTFNAEIEDSSDDFRAGSGFIRRTGDTQIDASARYNTYGDRGALVERWGPSLQFRGFWDHDDFWAGRGVEEAQVEVGGNVSFRGNITFWGNVKRTNFSFAPSGYEGLFVQDAQGDFQPFHPDQDLFRGLWGSSLNVWVNTFERIRGNVRLNWDEEPIFGGSDAAVEPATSFSANLSLNLYPTRSLQAEVGLRHTTIERQRDGSEYSTATIPRIKAQYQFSRAFFVRGIFEYASQERGPLYHPVTGGSLYSCDGGDCDVRDGSAAHDFHLEGLVSYEPSPGTVFYIGYTREMEDVDAFRFRDLKAVADGLFVKVSYRFRM